MACTFYELEGGSDNVFADLIQHMQAGASSGHAVSSRGRDRAREWSGIRVANFRHERGPLRGWYALSALVLLCFSCSQRNSENQSLVELSGSYKSMDCLDELITCLSECTKNHAECRKTYESSWVPTRLIDIDGYKQNGSVCLVSRDQVVAAQPNTHLRYATLSHVWGGHTFKTLKASNVSDLKYGFPVSGLPKTFAQAIDVTERIGLRYLWIDCLW
jgi:hypothetical protein